MNFMLGLSWKTPPSTSLIIASDISKSSDHGHEKAT